MSLSGAKILVGKLWLDLTLDHAHWNACANHVDSAGPVALACAMSLKLLRDLTLEQGNDLGNHGCVCVITESWDVCGKEADVLMAFLNSSFFPEFSIFYGKSFIHAATSRSRDESQRRLGGAAKA